MYIQKELSITIDLAGKREISFPELHELANKKIMAINLMSDTVAINTDNENDIFSFSKDNYQMFLTFRDRNNYILFDKLPISFINSNRWMPIYFEINDYVSFSNCLIHNPKQYNYKLVFVISYCDESVMDFDKKSFESGALKFRYKTIFCKINQKGMQPNYFSEELNLKNANIFMIRTPYVGLSYGVPDEALPCYNNIIGTYGYFGLYLTLCNRNEKIIKQVPLTHFLRYTNLESSNQYNGLHVDFENSYIEAANYLNDDKNNYYSNSVPLGSNVAMLIGYTTK